MPTIDFIIPYEGEPLEYNPKLWEEIEGVRQRIFINLTLSQYDEYEKLSPEGKLKLLKSLTI